MAEIGQLFMTGISGLSLTAEEKKFIEKENIGGVLLFAHNYEAPAQLAELVNSIQGLRKEYPLFIAVDHEGGRVIRFKKHFTQFPSMQELQKTKSPKMTFNTYRIMAEELMACGVNLNLAPVCDILTNRSNKVIGDRAFGGDPETVTKFISSAIRGLQTSGILACAKHFPGHGSTSKDSHFDLPYVTRSLEELESFDILPFVKAIKCRVEFLMLGHLVVDALDPDLPCTLSAKAVDYVRNKLKYSKIIISDDMQMGAIQGKWGLEQASVMAFEAGLDMLEFRDFQATCSVYEQVQKCVKQKELKLDFMKEKINRVNACKREHLSEYKPIYIPELSHKVGAKSHQIFLEEITQKIENAI